MTLAALLRAERPDLVDGFPARAAIAASKNNDPISKLNELLAADRIHVVQIVGIPSDLTVMNPFMLKLGVIAGSYDAEKDFIRVVLNESFFSETDSTIVVKALTFQSVCVHQLLHRAHKHDSCFVFYRPLVESMNREQELEAMGAGLAHDVRCKGIISTTGAEQLQELSPRLANIMANSSSFETGSIPKLQEYIKSFS
jgi:hypothetical protein